MKKKKLVICLILKAEAGFFELALCWTVSLMSEPELRGWFWALQSASVVTVFTMGESWCWSAVMVPPLDWEKKK